ncbi:hypothetical protein ABEB36_008066 [Hypothenemus hampei]|uniref:Alpha-1,3/1,6-mannosyltransferase ALG2 n=1 Tax=Hypothenemus hampei TaxID=57062 RepID=A0ABD1EMR7_HYPHA
MTKKQLKIAFIHPDLGIGGAERLVLDVANALKQQNHEILFITNHFNENYCFDDVVTNNYPIKVYGDWLPRGIFGRCHALCAYIRMIYLSIVYLLFGQGSNPPDLYFVDLIPVAIPFLKFANKKTIYYCHHPDLLASPPGGPLKKSYRAPIDWVEMTTTSMADIILVNSQYTASVFRDTFPNIKQSIQVLYPTIASSCQKIFAGLKKTPSIRETIKKIISTRDDLVVFFSINRFHPAKRLDFAIDAMDELRSICTASEFEKVFCILAGGYDPYNKINHETYEELHQLVEEKQLQDKVIFYQSPSDQFKVEVLAACTALLYTPLKEHFGIVPLEAMLIGKPVIAMNSGGPRETVDHGVTGYLCEPNAKSMAEYMYKFVQGDNPKDMGQKGKRRLEEHFSQQSFAKNLEQIIQSISNTDKKHN